MTAILDVIFPLTATWEDYMEIWGNIFIQGKSAKVKKYRELFLRSEGVQNSKRQQF